MSDKKITGKVVDVIQNGEFIAQGESVEYDRSLNAYHIRVGNTWLGHYRRDQLKVSNKKRTTTTKEKNSNFIGIELDPEYFKIAEKRILVKEMEDAKD